MSQKDDAITNWLTIGQAAREYGFTTSWLYALRNQGKIKTSHLGGDDGPVVISRAEMEKYISDHSKKEGATPTSSSR